MARRENISVSLTPEQAEFLAACVVNGRYQNTSEAVREGVRLLQDWVISRQTESDRARVAIQVGAEQLAQGRTVDGDVFFTEWDAELEELEAAGRKHHEV